MRVKPFNPEESKMIEDQINNQRSWYSELEQRYIHLFEVYEGEETERSYYKKGQVLRGIECGVGWKEPVERLLKSLDFNLKNNCYIENPDKSSDKKYIKDPDASIKIFQIKQKFGDVRCYAQANSKELQRHVDMCIAALEARCEYTCEGCGKVGKDFIRKNAHGWIHCLCDDCISYNNEQLNFDHYLRSVELENRKLREKHEMS